jgi:hypothetical protein
MATVDDIKGHYNYPNSKLNSWFLIIVYESLELRESRLRA